MGILIETYPVTLLLLAIIIDKKNTRSYRVSQTDLPNWKLLSQYDQNRLLTVYGVDNSRYNQSECYH